MKVLLAFGVLCLGACDQHSPANRPSSNIANAEIATALHPPQPTPSAGVDAENVAYEILALAIAREAGSGEPRGPYTLLEAPTLEPFVRAGQPGDRSTLQDKLAKIESIGPELATRFMELNLHPERFLGERFPPELPVEVMTKAEHKELFAGGEGEGWVQFYSTKFRGVYKISASQPAFNRERTRALVMLYLQEGYTHRARFMIGRRIGKSWTVYHEDAAPSATSP
jgi:hypothetical protein